MDSRLQVCILSRLDSRPRIHGTVPGVQLSWLQGTPTSPTLSVACCSPYPRVAPCKPTKRRCQPL